MIDAENRCSCGTGETYAACCGRYHTRFAQTGQLTAPTPEALMRSRFSAFALSLADYLLATWHPSSRPQSLDLEEGLRWYRLDVLAATGGPFDAEGRVDFVAYYRSAPGTPEDQRQRGQMAESSRFLRQEGTWYYLDGQVS